MQSAVLICTALLLAQVDALKSDNTEALPQQTSVAQAAAGQSPLISFGNEKASQTASTLWDLFTPWLSQSPPIEDSEEVSPQPWEPRPFPWARQSAPPALPVSSPPDNFWDALFSWFQPSKDEGAGPLEQSSHPSIPPASLPKEILDLINQLADANQLADLPWRDLLDAIEQQLPDDQWKGVANAVLQLRPLGVRDASRPTVSPGKSVPFPRPLQVSRPWAPLPFPLHRPSDAPVPSAPETNDADYSDDVWSPEASDAPEYDSGDESTDGSSHSPSTTYSDIFPFLLSPGLAEDAASSPPVSPQPVDADDLPAGVDDGNLTDVDGGNFTDVDGSNFTDVDGNNFTDVDGGNFTDVDGSNFTDVDGGDSTDGGIDTNVSIAPSDAPEVLPAPLSRRRLVPQAVDAEDLPADNATGIEVGNWSDIDVGSWTDDVGDLNISNVPSEAPEGFPFLPSPGVDEDAFPSPPSDAPQAAEDLPAGNVTGIDVGNWTDVDIGNWTDVDVGNWTDVDVGDLNVSSVPSEAPEDLPFLPSPGVDEDAAPSPPSDAPEVLPAPLSRRRLVPQAVDAEDLPTDIATSIEVGNRTDFDIDDLKVPSVPSDAPRAVDAEDIPADNSTGIEVGNWTDVDIGDFNVSSAPSKAPEDLPFLPSPGVDEDPVPSPPSDAPEVLPAPLSRRRLVPQAVDAEDLADNSTDIDVGNWTDIDVDDLNVSSAPADFEGSGPRFPLPTGAPKALGDVQDQP
eukprot:EG_transcript_2713